VSTRVNCSSSIVAISVVVPRRQLARRTATHCLLLKKQFPFRGGFARISPVNCEQGGKARDHSDPQG
jgi:hypothetical protein